MRLSALIVMQVDWTTGQLKMERNLTKYSPVFLNGHTDFENDRVPYPFRLAASKDNLAVISMVCCETWQVKEINKFNISIWFCFQAPLLALRLFSLHSGELTRTVKQLEDGRTVGPRFKYWTCPLLLVQHIKQSGLGFQRNKLQGMWIVWVIV